MTAATTHSARGTGGRVQGGGLILFASVMLVIIAADVVALYGLCAYGSRANLAA